MMEILKAYFDELAAEEANTDPNDEYWDALWHMMSAIETVLRRCGEEAYIGEILDKYDK